MSDEITLGNISITRIENMHGPLLPTDQFFPDMPQEAWDRYRDELVPDHVGADGVVHVAFQTWLVRSGGRTILIDTGIGNDKTRPAVGAWDHLKLGYLDSLSGAGVKPEDVDLVVNTHLHVDHVGWNTRLVDGEWIPTFPNATYLMPKIDFEYWDPANNPNIVGGVNENVFEDSIAPVHAAGQVQLWEGSHAIDADLRLEAAPGHTPGSSVVKLESGTERALFAGDLFHTPLRIMYPGHSTCFCLNPVESNATRQRLLGWSAENNALILPAHLCGHSALEIANAGNGLEIKKWAHFSPYSDTPSKVG
jgi:glyoxylase-like metal-dependent hydrolase (beta-lactamase superfamily II)